MARRASGFPNPWSYFKRWQNDRFQRRGRELTAYLEAATPLALLVDRLYREWREAVSEPIQESQKVANQCAVFWWHLTDSYRRFDALTPPSVATRYHKLFREALSSAGQGADIAKNGFRSNKFSEVSRGLGFLDRYVELMAEAEQELGKLLRRYRPIGE